MSTRTDVRQRSGPASREVGNVDKHRTAILRRDFNWTNELR